MNRLDPSGILWRKSAITSEDLCDCHFPIVFCFVDTELHIRDWDAFHSRIVMQCIVVVYLRAIPGEQSRLRVAWRCAIERRRAFWNALDGFL